VYVPTKLSLGPCVYLHCQYKLNKLLYRRRKPVLGYKKQNKSVHGSSTQAHTEKRKNSWFADADSKVLVNYLENNLIYILYVLKIFWEKPTEKLYLWTNE
jgi:hypothetical protein